MLLFNTNYAAIVQQARTSGATHANFNEASQKVVSDTASQDTLTLSSAALAKMQGYTPVEEIAPVYVKPQTARSLLAENQSAANTENIAAQETERGRRFKEVMEDMLDKRTGVDREKLEEIEAMMEEIANNENMSPEEKSEALELLAKMREKLIEESNEMRKQAKQQDEHNSVQA